LGRSSEQDELIRTLGEELRLCDTMTSLLEEERQTVERLDVDEMENLAGRKRDVRDRFLRLDSRRRKCVRLLAAKHGFPPDASVSVLAELLPEEGKVLEDLSSRLNVRLKEVRVLNSRNERMVLHALSYLRVSAGFISLRTKGALEGSGPRIVSKSV